MFKAAWAAVAAAGCMVAWMTAHAQQTTPGKAAPKGGVQGRLTWFDRQGRIVGTVGEAGLYRTLAIAHDGKRIAVERSDPETQNRDLWVFNAAGRQIRLTSNPAWEAFPLWSQDDRRIMFTSNRSGVFDLYQKASDGSGDETLVYKSSESKGPTSWSADGKFVIFYSLGQPTHVEVVAASGPAERKATVVNEPQFSSILGRFSPDGRWIAYGSSESGQNEVSLRPFDAVSGSVGLPMVITKGGARAPLWRGDGKELYYLTQDGTAMAVDIDIASGVRVGQPKALFRVPAGVLFWDAAPDGERFLLPVSEPAIGQ
jgi:eukaryotic-like serine/threonine-protein kinase